jgi:DNA modification methylase
MSEIPPSATWHITPGDVRSVLATWPAASVHTIITSPPYWGLRSYGTTPQIWGGDADCDHAWDITNVRNLAVGNNSGVRGKNEAISRLTGSKVKAIQDGNQHQIIAGAFCTTCGAWRGELGSEPTIDQYVANLVTVFRAVHRVLRPDGTLWLNIGDSYSNAGRAGSRGAKRGAGKPGWTDGGALGDKQLLLIPARVALALQADGWRLRSDIIWDKPNAMPESVKDRPSKSYEHLFLFSKQGRYYYDTAAIAEKSAPSSIARAKYNGGTPSPKAFAGVAAGVFRGVPSTNKAYGQGRNARDVWRIATEAFPGAHFATMPTALVERCILAGSRPGDLVADPFTGSGTVGKVAVELGRDFAGSELNEEYCAMARNRIASAVPYWQDARRTPTPTDLGPLFDYANRADQPALVECEPCQS